MGTRRVFTFETDIVMGGRCPDHESDGCGYRVVLRLDPELVVAEWPVCSSDAYRFSTKPSEYDAFITAQLREVFQPEGVPGRD